MNSNRQQTVIAGAALIALGIIAWLGLWHIIWPGALFIAGGITYTQRRRIGRTIEAVQGGLWCVGLGLLFLVGFVWPGILLLAGSSVLARGREAQIDSWIQHTLGRAATRTVASSALPTSVQPAAPVYPQATSVAPSYPPVPATTPTEQPITGETRRL